MTRRTKKRVSLAQTDLGPGTPAATANTAIEDVPGDGNQRKLRRRIHPLEAMRRSGRLSGRQYDAGLAISERYEATLTGPPAINENPGVDSTPDYGAIITNKTETLAKYARVMRAVPVSMRAVVEHVCCDGRYLRDGGLAKNQYDAGRLTGLLQVALDMVARDLNSGKN